MQRLFLSRVECEDIYFCYKLFVAEREDLLLHEKAYTCNSNSRDSMESKLIRFPLYLLRTVFK